MFAHEIEQVANLLRTALRKCSCNRISRLTPRQQECEYIQARIVKTRITAAVCRCRSDQAQHGACSCVAKLLRVILTSSAMCMASFLPRSRFMCDANHGICVHMRRQAETSEQQSAACFTQAIRGASRTGDTCSRCKHAMHCRCGRSPARAEKGSQSRVNSSRRACCT
jgi:hypothetical protein